MSAPQRSLLLFEILLITLLSSGLVYVSKNGTDSFNCGKTLQTACGTMYSASRKHIYGIEIFVYDGQNVNEIHQHFITNESYIWHPCLPCPESQNNSIMSITFNDRYINSMNDWFIKGVCYDNKYKFEYYNIYLFENVKKLKNVYIENYNTDTIPFSIFHADTALCEFFGEGFIFDSIHYNLSIPMIDISGNIILFTLNNSTFENIHSSTYLISVYMHSKLSWWVNFLQIYTTLFINLTFNSPLLNIDGYIPNVRTELIIIDVCRFRYIKTNPAIITFAHHGAVVTITVSDASFENISYGSIIKSSYYQSCAESASLLRKSMEIYLNNIFVSTSQTSTTNRNGIFNFGDIANVTINNMNVMYYYDLSVACQSTNNNDSYICENPAAFIYNEGFLYMIGDNLFNITITDNQSFNGMEFFQYKYNNISVIENYGHIYVNNLIIANIALGDVIFHGYGMVNLSNVIIKTCNAILNANMLQPGTIISQDTNNLYVYHSLLRGGRNQLIRLYDVDTVHIINTTFDQTINMLYAPVIGDFVMKQSKLYHLGCLYISNSNCVYMEHPLVIWSGSNVELQNNLFSYYPQFGFANFNDVSTLLLQNNLFFINQSGIKDSKIEPVLGIIEIHEIGISSTVINNEFINNHGDYPWLYYGYNDGVNCIFANKMDNVALQTWSTNLTSCFRTELIECFNENLCADGNYGKINKDIPVDFTSKSIFSISRNISSIWRMDSSSYIALDNVHIENKSIGVGQGNIFLLDSYLISDDSPIDIWYDNSSCNVTNNKRMTGNFNQIATFAVTCNNIYNYSGTGPWLKSMSAATTTLVNHFSATTLLFSSLNNTYWPGSLLYFNYSIIDIFSNNIHYNNDDHIPITINNSNLSLLVELFIDEYGECRQCNAGITIFGANLFDNFGGPYEIAVTSDYEYLFLKNEFMYLNIIGCPIGYGATANKYQCEQCPLEKYNLISNNTNECLLCDRNSKGVSQCTAYFDSLHGDYVYLSLLSLIVPLFIICIVIYCKIQYDKAFVVDSSLVLIIGISQFDDKNSFLPGVKQNVIDLVELWKDKYNYDVFVCNEETLYSTKQAIQDFIDNHITKIQDGIYQSVIVHVISHGSVDSFTCSDHCNVKLDFISHELITAEQYGDISSLIKLIFYHGCRGSESYHDVDSSNVIESDQVNALQSGLNDIINTSVTSPFRGHNVHATINDNDGCNNCADSNLVIISGNIAGRKMSDAGGFTKCVCDSFGKNAERLIKADLNSLFVEIGNKLENKTNHAEICTVNGNLRFNPVRFEKCKNEAQTLQNVEEKAWRRRDCFDHSTELTQRLLDENDTYQL